MKLALVGCGHIGGSLALALKRAGRVTSVVGDDREVDAARQAHALGIVDAIAPPGEDADVIVVAVPPRSVVEVCRTLPAGRAIVTDVASVKAAIVRGAEEALGERFVGGHPIAGTERSGPEAADADLFAGRRVILTPTARTGREALGRVAALWRAAGAEVVERTPEAHDAILAAVSHLPHAIAYALAGALAGRDDLAGMAGPSLRDVTRVAATAPALWVDVLQENREALLPALDGFLERLVALRDAIAEGDAAAVQRLLAEGHAGRGKLAP